MTGHTPKGKGASKATILILSLLLLAVYGTATAQNRWKFKGTGQSDVVDTSGTTTGNYTRWSYFPSASTTDGRFVSIVGANLQSMAGDSVVFGIGLPKLTDSLRIGIFDGETSGAWDFGSSRLVYKIYADPSATNSNSTLLLTAYGSDMTDNGWYNIHIATGSSARTTDSNYFYRLIIYLEDTTSRTWSNFKLRTNGTAALLPRAFAFSVPLFSTTEANVLYPSYPSTTSTTYDGSWSFWMSIPEPPEAIEVWDGDMDYGSSDGTRNDTDDADTPNSIPAWSTSSAVRAEGVATSPDYARSSTGVIDSTKHTTGSPADDNANALYRRTPSVYYTVTDPNGIVYTNSNPSGNLEWERFRISTIKGSRSDADEVASILPGGMYRIDLYGMDLGNLNAWRMKYDLLGMTDSTATLTSSNASSSDFHNLPLVNGVDASGNPVTVILPPSLLIGGTGTVGYWANHPEAWPVKMILVGDQMLTKSEALAVLASRSTSRSYTLAKQLIAAKLNIMAGNDGSCIYATIDDADAWLTTYPLTWTGTVNWTTGSVLKGDLEDYNSGRLDCAHLPASIR